MFFVIAFNVGFTETEKQNNCQWAHPYNASVFQKEKSHSEQYCHFWNKQPESPDSHRLAWLWQTAIGRQTEIAMPHPGAISIYSPKIGANTSTCLSGTCQTGPVRCRSHNNHSWMKNQNPVGSCSATVTPPGVDHLQIGCTLRGLRLLS